MADEKLLTRSLSLSKMQCVDRRKTNQNEHTRTHMGDVQEKTERDHNKL
jgi:hypothetical protein